EVDAGVAGVGQVLVVRGERAVAVGRVDVVVVARVRGGTTRRGVAAADAARHGRGWTGASTRIGVRFVAVVRRDDRAVRPQARPEAVEDGEVEGADEPLRQRPVARDGAGPVRALTRRAGDDHVAHGHRRVVVRDDLEVVAAGQAVIEVSIVDVEGVPLERCAAAGILRDGGRADRLALRVVVLDLPGTAPRARVLDDELDARDRVPVQVFAVLDVVVVDVEEEGVPGAAGRLVARTGQADARR